MCITAHQAQKIVSEMRGVICYNINIMDECGVILASSDSARRFQLHPGALEIIKNRLPSLTIWEDNPLTGELRGVNLPIVIEGKVVGIVGITGDPKEVSIFGSIIRRMAEVMIENENHHTQEALMERARELFVENWLCAPNPEWNELEIRGDLLHIHINSAYTVALLKLSDQCSVSGNNENVPTEIRNTIIRNLVHKHLEGRENDVCAIVHNEIIVLLDKISKQDSYSKIEQICQSISSYYNLKISAGISGPCKKMTDIRRCYAEAQMAKSLAAQMGEGQIQKIVFFGQVSAELVIESIPALVKNNIKNLVFSSCNEAEKEAISKTVLSYYDEKGNVQKCADKLYIHRNTMQYRINQIERLTGYNLKCPKEAFLLYVAALDYKEG